MSTADVETKTAHFRVNGADFTRLVRDFMLSERPSAAWRLWVRENVLPHLPKYGDNAWLPRKEIAERLRVFTGEDVPCMVGDGMGLRMCAASIRGDKPEFWAYYADYDWVVLCQLFGTMMGLPKHFPKFCCDLNQLSVDVGSPEHPKQEIGEHNALADARWNRDLYGFLMAKRG